jgi:hypothetical protein
MPKLLGYILFYFEKPCLASNYVALSRTCSWLPHNVPRNVELIPKMTNGSSRKQRKGCGFESNLQYQVRHQLLLSQIHKFSSDFL